MLARLKLSESDVEHTEDLIWLPETEYESILLHELLVLLGALASHLDNRIQSAGRSDRYLALEVGLLFGKKI